MVLDIEALKKQATEFRRQILKTTALAGSGHPGGSLSAVEILISLYGYKMKHDPKRPTWPDRDFLIVSKGHATPAVYVALANFGYFPVKELDTFRQYKSRLQGHVHQKVPGVEFNTGSLGHGLSIANGIALGAKLLKKSGQKVYCLLGDGEMQEGSNWEAMMSSAHFKLNNVCAIVDYNKVQENGPTNEIKNLEPLAEKFRSFGWQAVEVDGHDFQQIVKALDDFDKATRPYAIIAHTIKGKGVSFMEGDRNWHGKAPNKEQLEKALSELKG